jgi:hypothetical protein
MPRCTVEVDLLALGELAVDQLAGDDLDHAAPITPDSRANRARDPLGMRGMCSLMMASWTSTPLGPGASPDRADGEAEELDRHAGADAQRVRE